MTLIRFQIVQPIVQDPLIVLSCLVISQLPVLNIHKR